MVEMIIHNVRETSLDECCSFVKTHLVPQKYELSVEPYPQGSGHHLHLYLEFQNQRHFNKLLKDLNRLSNIARDLLAQSDGAIGRVQLTQWTTGQTWENVHKYLVDPIKDKIVGRPAQGSRLTPVFDRSITKYVKKDLVKARRIADQDSEIIRKIQHQANQIEVGPDGLPK